MEVDSMGEVAVPVEAHYGAQTQRAVENFAISGLRFPRAFLRTLGLVKAAAAQVNQELGLLDERQAVAIQTAATEVASGRWDDQFVVDIFQTGSGTSTNMNANEVIASRANELLGGQRGDTSRCGPTMTSTSVSRQTMLSRQPFIWPRSSKSTSNCCPHWTSLQSDWNPKQANSATC